MRFMILVKATGRSESAARPCPGVEAALTTFERELARAGVLLDSARLAPTSRGWRIRYAGDARHQIDGPFPPGDLVAGYVLIEARSREEAMEWCRRCPSPFPDETECEIEVRPLVDSLAPAPRADDGAVGARDAGDDGAAGASP